MPGSLEYKLVHYVLSNDKINWGDEFVYVDKYSDKLYRVYDILNDKTIECCIKKVLWHYNTDPTTDMDINEYIHTKIGEGDYDNYLVRSPRKII
jgi:hypothetical protein